MPPGLLATGSTSQKRQAAELQPQIDSLEAAVAEARGELERHKAALGKLSLLVSCQKVYRGMSGGALPESFRKPDALNFRGQQTRSWDAHNTTRMRKLMRRLDSRRYFHLLPSYST